MAELIQIETDRLFLRQWTLADRKPFAELNADPEVMRYFLSLLSRAESDALADRCEALIEQRGWGFWAVENKESGQFIGFVGLHIPTADLPFKPCVEVGWRLSAASWGKGYATEAARASLRVGFECLKLTEIVSFTAFVNTRSLAVMGRLGMVQDDDTFQHPGVPVGSELREHCLCRLSYESWRGGNRR